MIQGLNPELQAEIFEARKRQLLEQAAAGYAIGSSGLFDAAASEYDLLKPEGYNSVPEFTATFVDFRMRDATVHRPQFQASMARLAEAAANLRRLAGKTK